MIRLCTVMNGIELRIHWTFIVLVLFVALSSTQSLSLLLPAMFFVFLHELGHAWVAKTLGLNVPYIMLHGMGGLAAIDGMDKVGDRGVILISAAGPCVSFLLFVVFFFVVSITQIKFIAIAAAINLIIFVFNMLFIFPLDGGRILLSLLTIYTSPVLAARICVVVNVCLGTAATILSAMYGFGLTAVVIWIISMMGVFSMMRRV